MYIRRFVIENFKRFQRVDFEFNASTNVLTGVNNSGKTSVLEALALWAECFQRLVRPADRRVKGSVGAWRLGDPQHNYFEHDDLRSVRSTLYGDIFFDGGDALGEVLLEATLEPSHAASASGGWATSSPAWSPSGVAVAPPPPLTVSFRIRAARGGVYDIVLADAKGFDARRFNDFFTVFPQPVQTVFVSPVASIAAREEFVTGPAIRSRVLARNSAAVIRNRLYQLKKRPDQYQALLQDVSFVLFNRARPVEFAFDGDENTDVDLSVRVRLDPKEPFRDLSLLGSGSLQALEVLLGVQSDRKDLSIILLDEPDSHLHRDLHRRLLEALQPYTEGSSPVQLFLTTHNEALIRSTPAEQLFHLEALASRSYTPIANDRVLHRRQGLQPSRHIKVLQSLGNETALDFLNALEAERLVLVEGDDDARHIQAIVERVAPRVPFRAMYWAFQGIDTLLLRLEHYRTGLFEALRNEQSLWEKAALVFDVDYVTDDERDAMVTALQRKRGYERLPIFAWPAYTVEATVLIAPDRLGAHLVDLVHADTGVRPTVDLAPVVRREVARLAQRLDARLKNERDLAAIEGQRRARRHSFENGLDLKHPSTPSLAAYHPFAQKMLERGEVHHLASKDDVADVIEGVYGDLGHTLSRDGVFGRLIDTSTPATRPTCWDELARRLRAAP